MAIKDVQTSQKVISGEELAQMPDVSSCELVEGKIVKMSPTGFLHGKVEMNIGFALLEYVRERGIGQVNSGEVGIYTNRNPDTVRAADVLYISHEKFSEVASKSYLDVSPEIVVEVMSPSDSWSEVTIKIQEYLNIDVKEVWIADPELQQIFVYQSIDQTKVFSIDDNLTSEKILPGFSMSLHDIFDNG